MNYWWVNHKQTFRHEFDGGYIRPPTQNKNGARNHSYDNMTRVQPGDIIFSYADALIKAVGTITSPCCEGAKPDEFGRAGEHWATQGWLVHIDWEKLSTPVKPKQHIDVIRPLLNEKYAPIQSSGNGNQSCYLASISEDLAEVLFQLAGFAPESNNQQLEEDKAQYVIEQDESLTVTEKHQLVKARRGQGRYRQNLEAIESYCRLTRTRDKRFLIASHIKPWWACNNLEKLDGYNGLLLTPHVDKLFDQGWISFTDEGDMLIADLSIRNQLQQWSIDHQKSVGEFSCDQKKYLAYHRDHIYRGNKYSSGSHELSSLYEEGTNV